MPRHRSDIVIRLIAALKLAKAAMLIAVGFGALSMRHGSWLSEWIHARSVDPHGKYVDRLLAQIGSLDVHQLRQIGIGSLLYAVVFLIEGVGLMLRRMWAEVMTVIVTTSFIPLEIYELVIHRSWAKAAVIVVNVLVVLYLLRRLRRENHWPFHKVTAARTAPP
jgi:uncharacterized membrane protein (DUF2068 family)